MRSAICGKEAEEPTLQTRHQPEKYLFRYRSWSGASGTLCQNGSNLSSRATIPSRAGCLGIITSSTCEPMSRSWERTLSNSVVIWACLNRGRRSNHERKPDAPAIAVLPRSLGRIAWKATPKLRSYLMDLQLDAGADLGTSSDALP